jgi:histone arginine demethylase JMJD6
LKRTEWNKDGYYFTDATKQLFDCPDQIDRVNIDQLTNEEFIEKYEKLAKPVVLMGVTKNWKT